jgi:hypothetical protein
MKRTFNLIAVACIATGQGAEPPWWTMEPNAVLTPGATPDPYSHVNIGQAKWMAKRALDSLRLAAPSVADAVEADLVGTGKPIPSWASPTPATVAAEAQYAPLLIGQLKAISAPFYDHLHEFAPDWLEDQMDDAETLLPGTYYPWSLGTTDDDNHAVANQGQLKAVFSLNFGGDGEVYPYPLESDGIPDLWEEGVLHADGGVNWTDKNDIYISNADAIGAVSPAGAPPPTFCIQANREVVARLSGLTPSTSKPMYTTQTHPPTLSDPHGVYVRNPDFWGNDLVGKLTCISPANSTGAGTGEWNLRAGTVLTRRHIIMANHLPIADNDEIRFVTAGNVVVPMTLKRSRRVGTTDIRIGILDADLPSGIAHCKVPPEDFLRYLPSTITTVTWGGVMDYGTAGFAVDQEEKGLAVEFVSAPFGGQVLCKTPRESLPLSFNESIVTGDSGNPMFLVVADDLLFISLASSAGGGFVSGDAVWNYIDEINATIALLDADESVSTGYTLTEMDLSSFPLYEAE